MAFGIWLLDSLPTEAEMSEQDRKRNAAVAAYWVVHARPKAEAAYVARQRTKMKAAVRAGKLPRLGDGKTKCSDCRKPASQYDHRDYSKPLDVQPVCRNCNIKRGKGIIPEHIRKELAK